MNTTKVHPIAQLENLAKHNALPSFDHMIPLLADACLEWWADGYQPDMVRNGGLDSWLADCIKQEPVIADNYDMDAVLKAVARKIENRVLKVYIATEDDGYGDSTPQQIEAVRERMRLIAGHLRLTCEDADCQLGDPEGSHPDSELIFELAMDCRSSVPERLVAVMEQVNRDCPLPA